MKAVLFSAAFLASASVWAACPNLAGNYTCKSDEGSFAIEVTQSDNSGVTTYMVATDENAKDAYVADGLEKKAEETDDQIRMVASRISTCSSDALNVVERADYFTLADNQKVGEVMVETAVSKGSSGELKMVGVANSDFQGEKETQNFDQSCELNK